MEKFRNVKLEFVRSDIKIPFYGMQHFYNNPHKISRRIFAKSGFK